MGSCDGSSRETDHCEYRCDEVARRLESTTGLSQQGVVGKSWRECKKGKVAGPSDGGGSET